MTTEEVGKNVVDIASVGVVVGTLAEVLPALAAALTIVWTLIRIYESKTIQRFLGKKQKLEEE